MTDCRRGSVLMEYLVLLVFTGAVLASASNILFYRSAGEDGRAFGPMGERIQAFYQRTLGGLTLPVP